MAVLFIDADGVMSFVVDILILLLMCFVAYSKQSIGLIGFAKRVALYFLVSTLLGGFMTAMFSLLNRLEFFGEQIGIEEGIDVWIFAILAILSTILTLRGGKIFRSSARKEAIIEIEENNVIRLRALIDSGNLAYEPISGKSVIFVCLDKCEGLLSNKDYMALKNGGGIEEMPISLAMRIRPIFSKSIGGNSLLYAMRFKSVRVICGKMTKEVDVYIGFIDNEDINGYDAIISDELIM